VNEMVLADVKIAGKDVPARVQLDRKAFGYTMNRRSGFPRRAPRTIRETTTNFKARLRPEPSSAEFELHSHRRFDRRPRVIGECRRRRV
jgi:glucose dehydrogenase